jgi:hypothetical protein
VKLSSQVSPPAPAIAAANRSGSKSGDSSGYLAVVFLIIVAFAFFREEIKENQGAAGSIQGYNARPAPPRGALKVEDG